MLKTPVFFSISLLRPIKTMVQSRVPLDIKDLARSANGIPA